MIRKQSNFSRQLSNDAKMGAYYTDVGMSRRIGYLFDFPDTEVCVLEPSIGDGSALKEVLSGQGNVKVFGVELNAVTCKEKLEGNLFINYYLNADFLNGVKISHHSFGFCFSNPPYGVDDNGNRLEQRFVEKMYPYLKVNAPLALVIPHTVALEPKFLKSYMARFQPVAFFKFDDSVFKQFHQTVLVGIKRKALGYLRDSFETFYNQIQNLDRIPYLPQSRDEVKKKIQAVGSKETAIEYFTMIKFNCSEAGKKLYLSPLNGQLGKYYVKEYTPAAIGQPPVPLKKDLLYMLAIAGGGQGIVGSKENRDMHLQRGVAKVIKKSDVREENDGSCVEVEKSYTQIRLNVIQNDGSITTLE